MPSHSRIFRIFVSSTFSDLKAERNALQEKVFPKLKELCLRYGCRFQAIDLRWGVSEEASLDQQTMNICLTELKRCQEVTPRPNFIVLLGNRYGWRPLPYEIPAAEFHAILTKITPAEKDILFWQDEQSEDQKGWYQKDDNAVPPIYELRPRTGPFVDSEKWQEVEDKIRGILLKAIHGLPLKFDDCLKYTASATEQEIVQGALQVEDAPGHVFCFFRSIDNLPLGDLPLTPAHRKNLQDFLDLDHIGHLDSEAQGCLDRLKERLTCCLPDSIYSYKATWQDDGITTHHLDQLCKDVYQSLARVIEAEIGQMAAEEEVTREREAHLAFGRCLVRDFQGREDILNTINDYLRQKDSYPLAVWGESGSGKSALLAEVALKAQEHHPESVVVPRFLGVTPQSSDIRLLLTYLCREVSRVYGANEADLPTDIRKLEEEFTKRLALASEARPLILILDALDRLSEAEDARRLYWLPQELPQYVRLVASTVPGGCLSVLEKKLPKEGLVELQPLPADEGRVLLETWFADPQVSRTLTASQWQEVLKKSGDCGLPLYLKLAFEEARRWRSHDPSAKTRLSPEISGVIRDLFRRLSEPARHGEMLVSHSLGYLVAGKNGLTEDELLEVLSLDVEVMGNFWERYPKSPEVESLPVAVWSRLHSDLSPYLTERQADGVSLLAFYHQQLAETVVADYLFGQEKTARHAALADYFDKQPLYGVEGQWQCLNVRKVSELPYQQTLGELWEKVNKTLLDPDFLQSKVQANLAFELLTDYGRIQLPAQNLSDLAPQILDGLKRTSLLGKVLANVIELVMVDPSSVVAQLHLELQSTEEVRHVKELLRHLEIKGKQKPWLKHIQCHGADQVTYLSQIALHQQYVHFLAFSPDSRSLLIMDGSGRLALWHWHEGTVSFSTVPEAGMFRYATLLSNHQLLINSEKSLWLFDKPPSLWQEPLENGYWHKLLSVPSGSKLYSVSASLQAGYGLIAQSGDDGNFLHRIDAVLGGISAQGRLPSAGSDLIINGIAISPDGLLRAICFGDGELLLSTGLNHLAHWGGAFDCTFIKEGEQIATCGKDGTCALWDPHLGLVQRLNLALGGAADCLAYSPVRNLLAVGHRNGYVSLIALNHETKLISGFFPGVRNWILNLAFSPCGQYLAVGGRGGGVRVFAIEEVLKDPVKNLISSVPVGPVEKALFLAGELSVLFCDAQQTIFSTLPGVSTRYLPLHCGSSCLDFYRGLIAAALPDAYYFLDAKTGEPRHILNVPGYYRKSGMAISPDGKWLAVIEQSRLVVYELDDLTNPLKECLAMPLADLEEWISLKNPHDGLPLGFIPGTPLLALAIEPYLVARPISPVVFPFPESQEYTLHIINILSGKREAGLPYEGFCTALVADPEGEILALGVGVGRQYLLEGESGGSKRHVLINSSRPGVWLYSTRTWKLLRSYQIPREDGGITGIAIDPKIDLLGVTCSSGRIRLASLSRPGWITSVALADGALNLDSLPGRLIKVIDNGASAGFWPRLHIFEIQGADKTFFTSESASKG